MLLIIKLLPNIKWVKRKIVYCDLSRAARTIRHASATILPNIQFRLPIRWEKTSFASESIVAQSQKSRRPYTLTLTKANVEKAREREKNLSGLIDRLLAAWFG